MFSREFLVLAVAHWLALASPGPDFFLLLRNTWRHGRRHGLGTSFGIAAANAVYILLALSGFSVLQQYPALLSPMRWLAAGYLAYLGWGSLRGVWQQQAALMPEPGSPPAAAGGFGKGAVAGLLAAGMNPKNALFYLGLFTLLIARATSWPVKAGYAVWMVALVFCWDAGLVLLVSDQRVAARLARYQLAAEALAGALLLLVAAIIAVSSLPLSFHTAS